MKTIPKRGRNRKLFTIVKQYTEIIKIRTNKKAHLLERESGRKKRDTNRWWDETMQKIPTEGKVQQIIDW